VHARPEVDDQDPQRFTCCRDPERLALGPAKTGGWDDGLEGVEFSNCNCDYGCPCQFESRRPTYGYCRGFAAVRIDEGYFGDVALDGLGAALLYAWPGPIYEGNGECQAVIDERADGKQRDALATVLYGGETNEGATHWWVYRMMSSTVHPPLFSTTLSD
jgi:hypothetical protein